jgi:enhancing lycopene biosynthesis protein 2
MVTPRKAGIIISGGNPWEILFCFSQLEKHGYLRIPISAPVDGPPEFISDIEYELARTSITCLNDIKVTGLDALIIPGGKRLFNSLCNFQDVGSAFKVHEGFKALIKGMYRLGRPIGAFGAASVLVSKSLQGIAHSGLVVTVGSDPKLQSAIAATGAQAVVTRPSEVVLDQTNKIATSGGELGSKRPSEVYESCGNLITALNELMSEEGSIKID